MSDGFQYLDIILFAMVAAFLVLRLRSVLGRRTGTERPRNPLRFGMHLEPPPASDNVVSLPDRSRPLDDAAQPVETPRPTSVAAGIVQIRGADPSFDTTGFASGARGAFEMIVHAFASGDTANLRPLLSDEVYERFADAI